MQQIPNFAINRRPCHARVRNGRDFGGFHTEQSNGEGGALNQLAEIFSWIAEPTSSVDYYKKALEIYRRIGDLPRQIEVLAALGEAGYLTDEVSFEDGEKYFKEGQQLVDS